MSTAASMRHSTHKLQPIGIATQTVYPATHISNAFAANKNSIWDMAGAGGIMDQRGTVTLDNLLVEFNDAKVMKNGSSLARTARQVVSDVAGIDGGIFGLASSEEVRDTLIDRGMDQADAEMIIAEAYRQHMTFVGVSMSHYYPEAGDDGVNHAITAQYEGVVNFFTLFDVEPGDLLQPFIPTPTQMQKIDYQEFSKHKMWGVGQVPILFRPVANHHIADDFMRSMDLLISHPDIHMKLFGTRSLVHTARFNSLMAFQQYQKKIIGLGMYKWMKETNTAFYSTEPTDGRNRLTVIPEKREFKDDLDQDPANPLKFKLNTSGNHKFPHLRQLLYRNKVYNRIAKNGDNWADVERCTDPESFLIIWEVLNGLIEPGEKIPDSFEGLTGAMFAENKLKYHTSQTGVSDLMNMKRTDPNMTPLAASMQWNVDLLRATNLPYVRADARGAHEVGYIEDELGNAITNVAKTNSTYGRIFNVNTEIGSAGAGVETTLKTGINAMIQTVQQHVNMAPARCLRRNKAGQRSAATLIGSHNY